MAANFENVLRPAMFPCKVKVFLLIVVSASWCMRCVAAASGGAVTEFAEEYSTDRDGKKLFGGYKITPRFCKPTRQLGPPLGGPNICMFNHECSQRNGQVVGACMDGFLFGACCNLPAGTAGELMTEQTETTSTMNHNKEAISTRHPISGVSSTLRPHQRPSSQQQNQNQQQEAPGMGGSISQIAGTLLLDTDTVLTASAQGDNDVVSEQGLFSTTGVTHRPPDTLILNEDNYNELQQHYQSQGPTSTPEPATESRKTTMRDFEHTTPSFSSQDASNVVHVSIANIPQSYRPQASNGGTFQKPIFRPKPGKPSDTDKYVLVPTITHHSGLPGATKNVSEAEAADSIVNILQMLNGSTQSVQVNSGVASSTTSQGIFMSSSTGKPVKGTYIYPSTQKTRTTTPRSPPSTSYLSGVTPPRRPPTSRPDSLETKSTPDTFTYHVPTSTIRYPLSQYETTLQSNKITKRPAASYIYTSTPSSRPGFITVSKRPTPEVVHASSPTTVIKHEITQRPSATKKPPSTSYVYSSTSTKRPALNSPVSLLDPAYASTNNYVYSSPPPTVIVLSPLGATTASPQPYDASTPKPVHHVTINSHVVHNVYHSTERPPTSNSQSQSSQILITPKPSISTVKPLRRPTTEFEVAPVESETSADDLNNFPPVRNPNLNMSAPFLDEDDITTPTFVEDQEMDQKVETFVNKIIQSLQEPFQGLRDVVYNKNKTSTTKKPIKKQGTTTKKPATTKRPTKKSTTKKPVITTTLTTTTKKPTKVTTEETFIETEPTETSDFQRQCGVRPMMKSGRIVGGKGATFGEWPWQVLVRESTWLGLFTKNKCGGVLINNRYVITAAHCQPGFLASLVAVFGEFDISGERESKRSVSRAVKRVIVHRNYDPATFENDLALLELESPIQYDSHIVPICMPRDQEDFTGRMATVTGWGRLKYGGGVPSVLQEVQVPVMENKICQEMFRTAGHSKVILESFVCAGYANGQKDSCEGDSGGPLVLQRADGRWELAGTVSHGIKCAAPYLPGVYMRTTFFKPWLESITGIH